MTKQFVILFKIFCNFWSSHIADMLHFWGALLQFFQPHYTPFTFGNVQPTLSETDTYKADLMCLS